ncbi:MAG: hypothetical protein ACM34C_08930 [Syntrophaceae bacterium]
MACRAGSALGITREEAPMDTCRNKEQHGLVTVFRMGRHVAANRR